ncbi:DUF3306 domain-containing protein [Halomonas sp. BC04]|uniref:DUF3306 domain-containing protein n=1 Tax=Halomonas sp. BC04 TaxID=1403540 RepID=UPI0003ED7C2A|nr:DUF3306 domain-containing protein [Halomonas sp. BC04]EWH03782.1 hypothetical protein Q427_01395 [Halomonas sp. BC04]
MTDSTDDLNRLERWSRRKLGRTMQAPSPEDAPIVSAQDEVHDDSPPEASEPEAPAPPSLPEDDPLPGSLDETLPDPDTLQAGSDFTAFLQKGVSPALRRRALRQLYATGNYNVRDGLDDYDDDYSQLRPLARESAEKLRHWSRQLGQHLEEALDEAPDESDMEQRDNVGVPPAAASASEERHAPDDCDNTETPRSRT